MSEDTLQSAVDDIVDPLVVSNKKQNDTEPLFGCLTPIALFLLLWLAFSITWWIALIACVGLAVIAVIVGKVIADVRFQRAVSRFGNRFPEGSPDKAKALEFLSTKQGKIEEEFYKRVNRKYVTVKDLDREIAQQSKKK